MTENFNINSEDKKKMEDLLNQAKGIIGQSTEQEMHEKFLKEQEKFLDETSDFLINIPKDTTEEIYYRLLAEELPDLGLSFDDLALDPKGRPIKGAIAIKAVPFKTDREFINRLRGNQVITLLTEPSFSSEVKEKFGIKLESWAVLPAGKTARLLSRDYEERIKKFPEMKKVFDGRYAKYKDIRPLSDEEIKDMLRKEIREEYDNRE
jgi:hypothetical protein